MNILELKNVSYSYDNKPALDHITMAIKQGKSTAILGGNGAGKSTLFLNINGVLQPDEGEVFFQGERINHKNNRKVCPDIGIVFQDPNDQIFSESVRDDIAFGALNMGISKEKIEAMVQEVARQTGCSNILDKPVHALSFGQKKRVAIAGVLIMKPKVIILDEPTAGLDPKGVSEILNLLLEIKNELGITLIISTHEIDLVPLYCDEAFVFHQGKIVLSGDPKKIFEQPSVIRDYQLRTPRILHLMEILHKKDGLDVNPLASTIKEARATIKTLVLQKEKHIVKDAKQLKCGYTTGSCATAASAASTIMLLTGKEIEGVSIELPSKERIEFFLEDVVLTKEYASCTVIKVSGDDPDVTNGAKIGSKVRAIDVGIHFQQGKGVGVVTEEGLQCKVGEPAINPTPRKMIVENCRKIMEECGYTGGLEIQITVENGEEIAKKTFNPRLGIVGGISILGTTGIVEPMSEKALVDTIKIMIDKRHRINQEIILISPGNYGQDFCQEMLGIPMDESEKISNYVGEALDYIRYKGFQKILFVGHMGKLLKIAGGVMNTHSSMADCRLEILALYSALSGASQEFVQEMMNCKTTQSGIELLEEQPFYEECMKKIMDKMMEHCGYRLKGEVKIEMVMFDNKFERIIKSEHADKMIACIGGK